jgi:hypothetical protein
MASVNTLAPAAIGATRLHDPARAWVVLRQQSALLLQSRRVAFILVGTTAVLLLCEMVSQAFERNGIPSGGAPIAVVMMNSWLWLIGMAWAVAVWREENPARRAFHSSLPVDRAWHDVARVVVGGFWLCVAIAVALGLGALIALQRGQWDRLAEVPGWVAASAFIAPLLLYTLASAAAVALNRPAEWILGGPIVLIALMFGAEWLGVQVVIEGMEQLFIGRYGLAAVLMAGDQTAQVVTSSMVPSAHAASGGVWLAGAALWAAVSAGVLAFAASRRRLG